MPTNMDADAAMDMGKLFGAYGGVISATAFNSYVRFSRHLPTHLFTASLTLGFVLYILQLLSGKAFHVGVMMNNGLKRS